MLLQRPLIPEEATLCNHPVTDTRSPEAERTRSRRRALLVATYWQSCSPPVGRESWRYSPHRKESLTALIRPPYAGQLVSASGACIHGPTDSGKTQFPRGNHG